MYVKESYDVLNKTVDRLKKTNSEIENAMEKMSSTLMMKQKVINEYIEDCAKLKQELELQKIESLEALKEEKTEDTNTDKEILKAKAFVAQIVKDNSDDYLTDDYWSEKIRKYLAKKDENVEEEVREIKKQDKEIPVFEVKKEAVAEKVSENCENCETMKKQNSELIHNLNRMKESYDVLSKAMNQYNESSSEQATSMKTLKGAIYPIVEVEDMKTFEEEKFEEKDSETNEDTEEKTSGTSSEEEKQKVFRKQSNK
ncbi:myosin heavy chain, clone 203-like [Helianthus annuus]|uniref:myosin heavy chain, clone 203-like n=1 Tax=Helianthus annuus TaxID=4232 RepID=UPI000B902F08|nr:myosin heavy chain, clone 203-like [Helianthus annuus]